MIFLSTKRILKFSWQHFWRNIWLSIVTMTIIVLTLFSLTTLVLVNAIADYAVNSVKDTIDVSLYFDNSIKEETVQALEKELEKIEEKIDYNDHQKLIERINGFSNKLRNFVLALSIIFIFIAVLTVLNTIR